MSTNRSPLNRPPPRLDEPNAARAPLSAGAGGNRKSHGADPFIGNRPIAPIDGLGEDAKGAWYFGRLFPTLAARELAPLLAAGVLGSSFRFAVAPGGDEWVRSPRKSSHNLEGLQERTIRSARVYEFGPVTFPAHRNATAGTSTGAHPPRSTTPPRPRMSDAEWEAFLRNPRPDDSSAVRLARQRWLDKVMPLPPGRR